MPDNDPFRKYIDAGLLFTQVTRQRAEEVVRELIHNGEINRDQATRWVEELLERSRQSTEQLLSVVRKEIDDRITQLNLVSRDDLTNLATRITGGATSRGRGRGATNAATGTSAGAQPSSRGRATVAPATQASKQVATTRAATKPAATKQAVTKQAAPKQAAPKQAAPKEAAPKQAGTKTASAAKATKTATTTKAASKTATTKVTKKAAPAKKVAQKTTATPRQTPRPRAGEA